MVVHVTESNELSLLTLHIWLIELFVSPRVTSRIYQTLLVALPCENGKSEGKRKDSNGGGNSIIIEREVRNRRAMINDSILVGTCSGHHQHQREGDMEKFILSLLCKYLAWVV